VLGLAALLALAGMGFLPALGLVSSGSAIAEHGQGLADLIRDPRKAIRDFVEDMTPGEALAYAVGLIAERVLRGLGKRFADRFGPRRVVDEPGDLAARARRVAEHRDALAERYADDYERLSYDPDHRGVRPDSREEAKTMLDMRERGELPSDIDRPRARDGNPIPGAGDGWSPSTNTYYDIKAFRPQWGEFTKERVQETIDEQIRLNGRKVILDTRNLTGEQLEDLRSWVRPEWRDDVLWYDGGLR
jgi:hypothetical protein